MKERLSLRKKLAIIVFGTDTWAGQAFDFALIVMIVISIFAVMLESIPEVAAANPDFFYYFEWCITIIFTLEYLLRLYIADKWYKYAISGWGIVDLLSICPTYLSIFFQGYHFLLVIRILRLMRIFRVLRLIRFMHESQVLLQAIRASAYKIGVFVLFIFTLVVLLGTLMYVVEYGNPGFSSIPQSIYWGIVTITTVGYGDIVPMSIMGKFLAAVIMLSGYAIIAVPTGIVTAELTKNHTKLNKFICYSCKKNMQKNDNYCKNCGVNLKDKT